MCWAIYTKCSGLFEKYAKEFAPEHRARLVGTGAPLPAIRAPYLPQNELAACVPADRDLEGRAHQAVLPLPLDPNYFFNPAYMRRNPRNAPYYPSSECIIEAARIANLVLASPVSENDLTDEQVGYPYGSFSRGVNVEGDARVGEGAFAKQTYSTPREYRADSSGEEELESVRRRVQWNDPSGVALLYNTADRGMPVNNFDAM